MGTLRDRFTDYADIPFFQLRSVDLPQQFSDAIVDTEVAKQDIITAQQEKDNMDVTMETQILQAQQQANAIWFNANATAQSTLLYMQAWTKQYNITQSLQAQSLKPLMETVNKNETLLLEYMQTRVMRDHPD